MGGGQEAMNVTTTGARHGHFEVRFFHRIFEEEVAHVKGGFGPCNTIAAHPQGKGYSIGGEDGCEPPLRPLSSLPGWDSGVPVRSEAATDATHGPVRRRPCSRV